MRRSDRQHALVDVLRASAPRPVSAAELAERFNVTRRTIERDLAALQVAGVPLYAEHGRTGGYRILPDYDLPPLHLTTTEGLALAVGLALLEDSPFAASARSALAKVLAGMPDSRRAVVTATQALVHRTPATTDLDHGRLLAGALLDSRVVELSYRDGRGTVSRRGVEPLAMLVAGDHWYLAGWCRDRDGLRGFRTDRILEVAVTDELVTDRRAADVTADLARWSATRLRV